MTLKRGNFVLECNKCGGTIDLDTDDFDDAKELSREYKEQNGWATVNRRGTYIDLCGGCA